MASASVDISELSSGHCSSGGLPVSRISWMDILEKINEVFISLMQ